MKKGILFIYIFCFTISSCKQENQHNKLETESKEKKDSVVTTNIINENIQKKYSSVNFTECPVKVEQSFKASYDFETDKIINVDENSERIQDIDYVIHISNKNIIITQKNGNIIEDFQVIKKNFNKDLSLFNYLIEKNGDKFKFSHIIDVDGSYSYFTFRNKNTLREYLTEKY